MLCTELSLTERVFIFSILSVCACLYISYILTSFSALPRMSVPIATSLSLDVMTSPDLYPLQQVSALLLASLLYMS